MELYHVVLVVAALLFASADISSATRASKSKPTRVLQKTHTTRLLRTYNTGVEEDEERGISMTIPGLEKVSKAFTSSKTKKLQGLLTADESLGNAFQKLGLSKMLIANPQTGLIETKMVVKFLSSRNYKVWSQHAAKLNKNDPDTAMLTALTDALGEKEVAIMILLGKHSSASSTAKKLETAQFNKWFATGKFTPDGALENVLKVKRSKIHRNPREKMIWGDYMNTGPTRDGGESDGAPKHPALMSSEDDMDTRPPPIDDPVPVSQTSTSESREVPPRDGPKSKQKNNLARVTKKARSGPLVGIFTSGGYMGARSRLLEDIPDVVSVDETSLALALATINVDSTATDDLACTRRWLTMATTRPTSTAISMRRVATSATATTATTMDLRQRPLQERTLVALDPATLFIREPPNVNLGVPVFARGPITNLRAPEAALPNVHVADAPRLLRQITDTVPQLSNSVFPPAAPQVSEAMT
ncbi:hypothetical protein PC111_g20411 [Phytophthora cactorum]|nr:hypothetical protein PC111_g20411 [Phytophthora cactorum]